jgi:hypothetical protein
MAVKERRTSRQNADADVSDAVSDNTIWTDESENTVGSKFQFLAAERALILHVLEECDRVAKGISKGMLALEVSTLMVDSLRSRCALIKEKVYLAVDDGDIVEMDYKLRQALGTALSIHARKLSKLASKTLPDLMVDASEVEEAAQRTQHIANKIGEQLTMHLESEDEE